MADRWALGPNASPHTVMLYVRTFFRQYVHLRKFDDIDNTPTRDALRPYYRFAHEHPLLDLDHPSRSVCTLVAPAIRQCYQGIVGVPSTTRSYDADAPYGAQCDVQYDWARVRTKHWQIKNPLARVLAIVGQRHEACVHSAHVRAWSARLRAYSRSRKVWEAFADQWHRPVLGNFSPNPVQGKQLLV